MYYILFLALILNGKKCLKPPNKITLLDVGLRRELLDGHCSLNTLICSLVEAVRRKVHLLLLG